MKRISGGVNGVKHEGTWASLKDCIELHKLTVSCDAAEKQKSHMMSSLKLKRPLKMTVRQHNMCMEVVNGYLAYHIFPR